MPVHEAFVKLREQMAEQAADLKRYIEDVQERDQQRLARIAELEAAAQKAAESANRRVRHAYLAGYEEGFDQGAGTVNPVEDAETAWRDWSGVDG